jgi:hypothetical protein
MENSYYYSSNEQSYRMDYLVLPLKVGYHVAKGSAFSLLPKIGLELGYAVKKTTTFRPWEVAGSISLEGRIHNHWSVSVDYSHGISSIQKQLKTRNSTGSLSIGYIF